MINSTLFTQNRFDLTKSIETIISRLPDAGFPVHLFYHSEGERDRENTVLKSLEYLSLHKIIGQIHWVTPSEEPGVTGNVKKAAQRVNPLLSEMRVSGVDSVGTDTRADLLVIGEHNIISPEKITSVIDQISPRIVLYLSAVQFPPSPKFPCGKLYKTEGFDLPHGLQVIPRQQPIVVTAEDINRTLEHFASGKREIY